MFREQELNFLLQLTDDFLSSMKSSRLLENEFVIEVGGSASVLLQNIKWRDTKDIDIICQSNNETCDHASNFYSIFPIIPSTLRLEWTDYIESKVLETMPLLHGDIIDFNCGQVIELLPDYKDRLVNFDNNFKVLRPKLLSKIDWVFSKFVQYRDFERILELGILTARDLENLADLRDKFAKESRTKILFDRVSRIYGETLREIYNDWIIPDLPNLSQF